MNIHVGDTGTVIEFTVTDQDGMAMNLSTYDALRILIGRPDGTTLEKTAVLTSSGTDGKMRYVSVADDFNTQGTYHLQGLIDLPSGLWHTEVVKQKVLANVA